MRHGGYTMRHLFLLSAALLLASCTTVTVTPQPVPLEVTVQEADGLSRAERNAKPHAVQLGDNYCSATKVGKNVILTATHCLAPEYEPVLVIDGKQTRVMQYIDDGNDHTLVVVRDTYDSYAKIGERPEVGSSVFLWGNSLLDERLQRGYISIYTGTDREFEWNGTLDWMVIDIMFAGGDSGGGLFDSKGRLVGVVTGTISWDDRGDGAAGRLGVALPFAFKLEEIRGLVDNPAPLLGD